MKCISKFVLTCVLLVAAAFSLQAKNDPDALSSQEKKADLNAFAQKFDRAENLYLGLLNGKELSQNTKNRVQLKLADVYYVTRQYDKAENAYESTIANYTTYTTKDVCNFIDVLVRFKKYRRAEEVSRIFLDKRPYSEDVRFRNQQKGLNGQIKYMMSDSSQYTLRVAPFSSEMSDFWCMKLGNDILFICSDQYGGRSEKDLVKGAQYYTFDGTSIKPYTKVNSTLQAGPATMSSDSSIMIYTDNRYSNKMPRKVKPGEVVTNALVLRQLTYDVKNRRWVKPVTMFPDREDVSYCHPSLSPDGQYLFYASNMPGGFGGMDIYVVRKTGKGTWGPPVNLGPEINTSGEEVYPYIQGDRLQFSSNGHIGLGGQDVFYTELNSSREVIGGSLRHMAYPVNTSANDYAMLFTSDKDGYVSSDRDGSRGLDDIYRFVKNVTGLEGLGLLGMNKGDLIALDNGRYMTMDDMQNFQVGEGSIPDTIIRRVAVDLVTDRVESDLRVFFEYNDAKLNSTATKAIEKFVAANSNIGTNEIIVMGYADETGQRENNLTLSLNRAESVKNYLVSKGYPARVIHAMGKGQLKLFPQEEKPNSDIKVRLAPARKVDIKFVLSGK